MVGGIDNRAWSWYNGAPKCFDIASKRRVLPQYILNTDAIENMP